MQVDCRNLACPAPVIKTKEALKSAKIGESIEIILNETAAIENVKRFLQTNGYEPSITQNGSEATFKIQKTGDLKNENAENFCDINHKKSKVVFLNEESCGSGAVGKNLLSKFLGSIANLQDKPKMIICVNNAVFMTTNRSHESFGVLKNLENLGIEILSCGSCLEAYKLVDKLAIGRMSNALEIMEILSENEAIKL
ncbi:MAG: sulfurtransferase-like selenium metabolism protein YedF [Campylobacter sp.]|nr:sulfurtransferase-like selenium metabolism protein YedF [Campylobacter sp.]